MRKLNAERFDPADGVVVCVDNESGDEFALAVDDRLRALIEPAEPEVVAPPVESGAELSPREIQARVRSGATVAELAEVTGVREDKIYRFAHPVLLERSRAAELARASHPAGIDGPSVNTLGELVGECLVLRGNSPAEAAWDAWRRDDGRWVVQVGWSGNVDQEYAHWRFSPGSHGGTTEPLDDLAVELTEPELARSNRRTMMSVVPPVEEPRPQREVLPDGHEQVTLDADTLIQSQTTTSPLELDFEDERATNEPPKPASPSDRPRHRSGKRATPSVPAWEDVLLGVRSHPGE
ncbi:septation protein SepH [Gordonia zhaorongruii]|uniref:septation protein SepH n=1 Tax=Gordonia zhaorongruii TaxID=2597659 RepID=UPI0010461CD4|nr:septation protein SepH [Gordonia zhaorongruii]